MSPAAPGRAPADPIQEPGTDESEWRRWPGWASLREAQLPDAGRVVVVAAHPDDEVLGVGGCLALLAARGVGITLVSVTDGEGSHPGSTAVTPDELTRVRAAETRAALAELGAGHADVVRLGVPDTLVGRHEQSVADALVPLLSGAALVMAPWTGDVHGDHEAAGRAARAAARSAAVPCRTYPVWMWHWATPGDPRVPWDRAGLVALPPEVQRLKRAAVARFRSQTEPLGPAPEDAPVLPPDELAHHLRTVEVLFT
ncbi:PIG-L deacetylase family protein [Streptomyces sp. NPDC090306]|uniref:PIG-L deacetylase family protein n=1 Tax=unclassified Streptomyces TaxID=2593676 RepID=UPI0036ECDA09